jgi:hypothetical protein
MRYTSELILVTGFVAETTTFIIESAEDVNDLVVRVPSIEKCSGKCRREISGLWNSGI